MSKNKYKGIVKDKMMGVESLKREDQHRFGKLTTSIRDQYSFKKDVYPKTLHNTYELLVKHSLAKESKSRNNRCGFVRGRERGSRSG